MSTVSLFFLLSSCCKRWPFLSEDGECVIDKGSVCAHVLCVYSGRASIWTVHKAHCKCPFKIVCVCVSGSLWQPVSVKSTNICTAGDAAALHCAHVQRGFEVPHWQMQMHASYLVWNPKLVSVTKTFVFAITVVPDFPLYAFSSTLSLEHASDLLVELFLLIALWFFVIILLIFTE